jgi:CRP-like cAMP-binding protein
MSLRYDEVRQHAQRHWESISPASILGQIGPGRAMDSFLSFLCQFGIQRRFGPRTKILLPHSSPRAFLILEGQIKITDHESVVGICRFGDLLGAAEVLAGNRNYEILEAEAIDPIIAVEVAAHLFRDYVSGEPAVAHAIMLWTVQQLTSLQRHRLGYRGSAGQRLIQCLLDLGLAMHPRGEIGEFTLPVTQRELAASVDISIATAENELRNLKRSGIVCKKPRRSSTRILRPARMRGLLRGSEPLLPGSIPADYDRFVDPPEAGQVVNLQRGRLRT